MKINKTFRKKTKIDWEGFGFWEIKVTNTFEAFLYPFACLTSGLMGIFMYPIIFTYYFIEKETYWEESKR